MVIFGLVIFVLPGCSSGSGGGAGREDAAGDVVGSATDGSAADPGSQKDAAGGGDADLGSSADLAPLDPGPKSGVDTGLADAGSADIALPQDTAGADTDPCAGIVCKKDRVCDPETRICVLPPAECDPVAQDCGAGKRCALADVPGGVACAPDGSVSVGAPCGPAVQEDCKAGGVCVTPPGASSSTCAGICEVSTGAGCAQGEICYGIQEQPTYGACGEAPPSCDVIAQDCKAGSKCTLVSASGAMGCVPDGTAAIGASCGSTGKDDCAAGGICLGTPPDASCLGLCRVDADCAEGTSCYAFQGLTVGHCMAPH